MSVLEPRWPETDIIPALGHGTWKRDNLDSIHEIAWDIKYMIYKKFEMHNVDGNDIDVKRLGRCFPLLPSAAKIEVRA